MSGKKKNMARGKQALAAAGLIAAVFLAVVFLLHSWESGGRKAAQESNRPAQPADTLTNYQGSWYRQRRGVETLLVLGIDKSAVDASLTGGGMYEQCDFLLLLVMDRQRESCTALHINRDTMAEIRKLSAAGRVLSTFTGQLALAHAEGGDPKIACRNTANAVSRLLYGVPVNHYASLAMDGVPLLTDQVGGVAVEVLDDFTGVDESLVKGETAVLRGQQALTYVRARQEMPEDGTNLRRMERQKQYLEALESQLRQRADGDSGFAADMLLELNEYIVSDCSIEQLAEMADILLACGEVEYRTLEGEAVMEERHIDRKSVV